MGHKDARKLYELKSAAAPPKTLDAAAEILAGMLRGRRRCDEIDELESDPKGLSLVALDSAFGRPFTVRPPSRAPAYSNV